MKMKEFVENNLKNMSELSVQEYTLYRKWYEINSKLWSSSELQRIYEIREQIWIPTRPEDFELLQPKLVHVNSDSLSMTWKILRTFICTLIWNQNVGRLQRFILVNKVDNKFLGVISIASDFLSVGGRDEKIGWNMNDRVKNKMINHTGNGSSIVPTQPFGFNFVGGKLLGLLTASDAIENAWNSKYKDKLVGLTTTSLYGGFSQYSRLKYWDKCKSTQGKIPLEPDEECYRKIRKWVKEKYPKEFVEIGFNKNGKIVSRPKARMLAFAYKQLGIKPPVADFPRGVYWCPLFNDTNKFLRREIKSVTERRFDNSVNSLVQIWKGKYARKRVSNLEKSGKYNNKLLYYDELIKLNWNETKEKYITEVGR